MLDSIGDSLTLTAGKYPEKTALIDFQGKRLSYEEFNQRVNRLANALMADGVKQGDKVAYLFLNSSQFLESHYAVAKIGAVGVPLNFRLVGQELKFQIQNADVLCLIFGKEFADTINSIKKNLTAVKTYICNGKNENEFLDYENFLQKGSLEEPGVQVSLYDQNLILHTAGTTGAPKGSVLSHKNSLFNALTTALDYGFQRDEVLQIVPPLYHSASLNAIAVAGILMGNTLVIHSQFNPEEMMQAIEEEKVTMTWGPATMLQMLISTVEKGKYDTSRVRLVINGAMYMPASMRKKVLEFFSGAQMGDTYGMTEASPCTTILPPEEVLKRPSSVGLPLTLCDVKIFSEDGQEVPPEEVGEIVTRGNVMQGYYKNEQATRTSIKDGWLYTGDMGKKDEAGFVYLVDRKKDMIVSGGENVYSKEVEEAIILHPKVMEAAVIGLEDEKWGQVVTAIVVPLPGQEIEEQEIFEHCREQIAGYKCPRQVKIVSELPKNPAGKVVKKELREKFSI